MKNFLKAITNCKTFTTYCYIPVYYCYTQVYLLLLLKHYTFHVFFFLEIYKGNFNYWPSWKATERKHKKKQINNFVIMNSICSSEMCDFYFDCASLLKSILFLYFFQRVLYCLVGINIGLYTLTKNIYFLFWNGFEMKKK